MPMAMVTDTLKLLKQQFKKSANQYPVLECYTAQISLSDWKGNNVEDMSKCLEDILMSSKKNRKRSLHLND
jgi:hypothetical protein